MRKLISVAVVSAIVGAVLALWAQSTVVATTGHAVPARAAVSPHDIMRSAGHLPIETFEDPN